METKNIEPYVCPPCGFIYDPKEGDPDGGIAPGTPFSQIPADWLCPICGLSKLDFVLVSEYYKQPRKIRNTKYEIRKKVQ